MPTNKDLVPGTRTGESKAMNRAVALAAAQEGNEAIQQIPLETYIGCLQDLPVVGTRDILALLTRTVPEDSNNFGHRWILGSSVTLIILPCDDNGRPLTREEIQEGKHIRLVVVDKKTRHSGSGDKYPAVLPTDIWEACTFEVTDRDPNTFTSKVLAAYGAWKKLTQHEV